MNHARRLARGRGAAIATAITGVAVAAGAAIPLLPRRARPVASLGTVAAVLGLAVRSGLDADDLGCSPDHVAAGARAGLAASGLAAAVVAASVGPPGVRALFADARVTDASDRHAAFEVLVRIPVVTALSEELVFRGAVLGAWRRTIGAPAAVVASSIAFGIWHVLPALESHTHNPAGARLSGRAGGRPAHVVATVLATAAVGAGFAGLRLRSHSVVAPVVAHTALNELGYLAARWAGGRDQG